MSRTAAAPRPFRRAAIAAAAAAALLTVTTGVVQAQTQPAQPAEVQPAPAGRWDFTIPGGMVIPTGAQRDAIERANVTAAQLSFAVRPSLALTATFGWARSRDVASSGDPKLDVFTYDVGAELRAAPRGGALTFSPFAGIGAGARSYNYRSLTVDATHNPAAYASAGAELRRGRFGLRLEARDYVSGFRPLDGVGASATRNDVVVLAGLRFDWR